MENREGSTSPIRVLVVEDHTLVREGIVKILSSDKGIEVIGEAGNGFEALTKTRELKPDAVLMDLYMPGMDGFAATRLIKREMPQVHVIVLTVSNEEDDILEAVRAGARGYIVKSVDASDLIMQLKQVVSGAVAMSEDMTNKLVTGLARKNHTSHEPDADLRTALTQREKEVLALIAQGATNKGIAASLIISEHTVRAHVRSLMQKLNLDNRTQLAVYGIREGFGLDSREQHAGRAQGRTSESARAS